MENQICEINKDEVMIEINITDIADRKMLLY